jgi:molybdenum cofactor biosynthesis enzyme MoaA
MDIYKLLKLNRFIKNHRVKFFAIFLLHVLNRRYLAVNLDPVMACNLRCKMCYFSDPEYVRSIKGQFTEPELERVAKVIFKRALKLQIGCGTEPTLYKNLVKVVSLGKQYKVPYISITTNANLLDKDKIKKLLDAGLNEFTISLHGVTKQSYEHFMKNGNYDKFCSVFNTFKQFKNEYNFKVRVNYTFNKDNFYELNEIFTYFDSASFDILQIRPIRNIGNSEYNDFNLDIIKTAYHKILNNIKETCRENAITLLAPDKISNENNTNQSSFLFDYTFCYVSPTSLWKSEFDWKNETFNEFSKRIGWHKILLSNVFTSKKKLISRLDRLNYEITS